MTLPAQSLPDATEPDNADPWVGGHSDPAASSRDLPFPLAFISVVGVSALVIILCVLGAAVSGGFGFLGSSEDSPSASVTPEFTGPTGATTMSEFADGVWLVPGEIAPGTYTAKVPANSPGCAWERRSSTSGTTNSVLESGTGTDGEVQVVVIQPTDKVFQAQGCGKWRRTSD